MNRKSKSLSKHRYWSIPLILLVIISCNKSFLDKKPQGNLGIGNLTNLDGLNGLLTGAYASLGGQNITGGGSWESSPSNWIYGSVAGGDSHKGSDLGDQPAIVPIATGNADPSNGFFNSRWITLYEGVTRCNAVIKTAALTKTVSDADKLPILAQARFLRGHFYFELKRFFNMVPWIDENTTDFRPPNDKDIWPNIEADFKYAADNLPETQTQISRANKWAATTYLAKTYLYEKKYPEAKQLFDQVIASGVTSGNLKYDLNNRFEDNFDAATKNGPEAVFAIQMVANDGTNSSANGNNGDVLNFPYGGPFPCCGFFQPSIDLANSYRTDANGLPYLTSYNDHPVKNDLGVADGAAYTPDNGPLDPRIDWTIGRRAIPFNDWGIFPGIAWIRNQPAGGPYVNKKNIFWQANASSYNLSTRASSINWNVIRFADVLLMAAECEAQLGNLNQALVYVNRVRARAMRPENKVYTYKDPAKPMGGFTTTPAANYQIGLYASFSSQQTALTAIYFERKLELACEGHRYFDLARWGIGAETMNAYYAYESKFVSDLPSAHYTKGKNEYYPIPQVQVDLSNTGSGPTLKQYGGYR